MRFASLACGTALLVIGDRHARACGVPDFGDVLVAAAEAFASKTTPVDTPLLAASLATDSFGVSLGYGWGEKQAGGLFPGSSITRVLANARIGDAGNDSAGPRPVALALTYGWYENHALSLGLDLGLEARVTGDRTIGPTGRFTIGVHGIDLRLTGTADMGAHSATGVSGAAEVVIEVMELAREL